MDPDKKTLIIGAVQNILHEIEEGIHVVDNTGVTVYYNEAMERIEGISQENVVGKNLLQIYPDWSADNSTLLMSQEHKIVIKKEIQSYINYEGKKITTQNITYPIMDEHGDVLGSVEIAKNYTNVSVMSDQIRNLQDRIVKKNTTDDHYIYKYHTFDDLIGRNKNFLKAIKFAMRSAETDSSVLIQGETGTGKEIFAQSIHSASARKDKPFIAQNCAALPETLLEGIMFGTTKGSFTGAENKAGLFEQANGGTLFLDEINSMSESLQAKLLRVLQEGYFRRIGGQKDIRTDVRVIAATNIDLTDMIRDNRFRKDLYYRINVMNIEIPPLRERREDIPLFIEYFIRFYNKKLKKDVWMLSKELTEMFINYTWRGNVRELRNFIESSMNMVDDEHVINKEHLPTHVENLILMDKNASIPLSLSLESEVTNMAEYLETIEKNVIEHYLAKYDHNITKTAAQLHLTRQGLQYKIAKYFASK